jgi:hypothetical protein
MTGFVGLAREIEDARARLRAACRKWLEAHAVERPDGDLLVPTTDAVADALAESILSAREDASAIVRTEERHRAADYMRFDGGCANSLAEDIATGRHMAASCEHHDFNHHGCRDCERLFLAAPAGGAGQGEGK